MLNFSKEPDYRLNIVHIVFLIALMNGSNGFTIAPSESPPPNCSAPRYGTEQSS
jgi:hypothetical protein